MADLIDWPKEIKIILGSSSPQRQKILTQLGFTYEIIVPQEEKLQEKDPYEFVTKTAFNKLQSIVEQIQDKKTQQIIISSDTIVALEDQIIGKPTDAQNCKEILTILSNKEHIVLTCIYIGYFNQQAELQYKKSITKTVVKFGKIDNLMMDRYVAGNVWQGKAGGYAIQDQAAIFIENIQGCFYNVVGFPIFDFITLLKEALGDIRSGQLIIQFNLQQAQFNSFYNQISNLSKYQTKFLVLAIIESEIQAHYFHQLLIISFRYRDRISINSVIPLKFKIIPLQQIRDEVYF